MPAIQVAKTDTFEQQRVKINEIGTQIFNVTAGGTDLSTGNLRLGDGTRTAPSLAFTTDNELGIYKPAASTLGFVAAEKKLLDISSLDVKYYKDIIIQQKKLYDDGLVISNSGQNYDPGTYTEVPVLGGTGDGALFDITVVDYDGTITNAGANYTPGLYSGIALQGGSGTGATCNFEVPALEGAISAAGSAYAPGSYVNAPFTGGSGTGARADVTITGTTSIPTTITNAGSGYVDGIYSGVVVRNTPTQTLVMTVVGDGAGVPYDYVVDGTQNATLSLVVGNTYRFDLSDASNNSHPLYFHGAGDELNALDSSKFTQVQFGVEGTAGAFVDLIVHETAVAGDSLGYACGQHSGMGGTINIIAGSAGVAGRNATAEVTIAGGIATDFSLTDAGNGYKNGDTFSAVNTDLGGTGSGLLITAGTPTYTGTVTNVTVTDQGQNYQGGDILSIADADLGGGGGSGFTYTIGVTPGEITDFEFSEYGDNYAVSDVLALPSGTTGVSAYIPGTLNGVSVTLGATTSVTVPDSTRLEVGMTVFAEAGSTGDPGQGVTIAAIPNATTITLSQAPSTAGAATLTFSSIDTLNVTLTSVANLSVGDSISVTSGTAILQANTTISSIDVNNNIITLSGAATEPGQAVLSFSPSFGVGTTTFAYRIDKLGSISTATIAANNTSAAGNGYSENDSLTVSATNLVQANLKEVTYKKIQTLTLSGSVASGTISVGDTANLRDGTIVTFIPTGTTILAEANQSYTTVAGSGGTGSGATFNITRDAQGVATVTVASGGFDYETSDTLTILGTAVGGATPADDISIDVDSVTDLYDYGIVQVNESGGNTTSIVIEIDDVNTGFAATNVFNTSGTGTSTFTVNTSVDDELFLIDDVFTPNLTFYVGDTYRFNLSDGSLVDNTFALSSFEGGAWSPSRVENVVTTVVTTNKQITVASTTGISAGMEVTAVGVGQLNATTFVASVDSATQLTLNEFPINDGTVTLTFAGAEYTTGVTREADSLEIKITSATPNLYYYSKESAGIGSTALITMDSNNPRVFGTDFTVTVNDILSEDVVTLDIDTGTVSSNTVSATDVTTSNATVSGTLTATNISGGTISLTAINSTSSLTITSPDSILNGNVYVGSTAQSSVLSVSGSTGNLQSSGFIKTLDKFNSNDQIEIEDNNIRALPGFDVLLTPAATRVAKVDATSALIIPAGDTNARPSSAVVEDGAIRFNTDSGQYEGYNATTTSWSSLGGVRDLDGNTYIAAEETVGANDNKLWFYNDGDNTIRVTPNHLEFVDMKRIRSVNVAAPAYTEWAANTPVTAGSYVKYRNNIFAVTVSGTTATSGNEPTDTSGNTFANGSATLQFHISAVGLLTFEEIEDVQIGPLGGTPLTVGGDLRLLGNEVSTLINDINLRPNAGKKVKCDINTSLVVPAGTTGERGTAEQGSIRYNTTTLTYEGYDGTNWGSLGGVKDVDQNTYIIPETVPGANENILYFYNDGANSMQLTTTALDFLAVDTIRSLTSNEFEITANLMTFNGAQTTLDNTAADTTFLHTSKQYFDIGLSAGLTVDPVLRLDNQGDVFLNIGFGTGVYNGVKVFDSDLKEFELADVKILSEKLTLTAGTVNNAGSNIFEIATQNGAKVIVVAENTDNNEKEFFEFGVIDDGTDIFHTQYGNIRTDIELVTPTFERTASGFARINFAIGSGVTAGHNVVITIVSNVTKK